PRLRAELRRDRRGERGTERVGALEAAEVAAVGAAPAGDEEAHRLVVARVHGARVAIHRGCAGIGRGARRLVAIAIAIAVTRGRAGGAREPARRRPFTGSAVAR